MTEVVIRGGTVVTAGGSRLADVAVADGRIVAIEPDLSGVAASAGEVIDATGLLVLPGAVDAHTHTRVASDAEPDRFFQDSVAAAFGGTTSFLSFNNPGTGSSPAAERSLVTGVREWRAATDADSAIDYGLSLAISGHADDPLAELPATIDAGVATSKAFMVFDFRLPDERLFEAMRVMARHGGMLQVHCEDPVLLDAAVADALQRGDMAPRYHATTRPPFVEAVATARALAFARQADAPVHVVHLSSAAALDEVRRAKAAGVRVSAETCPHYLVFTEARIRRARPRPVRPLHDRAAAPVGGRPRRPLGRPGRRLARPRRDGPRPGSARRREGRRRARRAVQRDQQRRSRASRRCSTILYSEGVARGPDHARADGRPHRHDPARRFGLAAKGAIEVGRDADIVLFDPAARRTIRATDLHHTSDYTPYEGIEVAGAVRDVLVRGRGVIRARRVRRSARRRAPIVERGQPAG